MNLSDMIVFAQSDWDHHDGGWIVMGFAMLLFWVLVIVLVVWLVRTWAPDHHGPRTRAESALDVLDRRLAEGGISVEEYEERRRILSGHGAGSG